MGGRVTANYAINPTPEQVIRSNRAVLPARVIAALDLRVSSLKLISLNCRERAGVETHSEVVCLWLAWS